MISYSNLKTGEIVEKTVLLDLGVRINNYSTTKLRDEKIYFTGGAIKKGEPASNQVIEYDLRSNTSR